MLMNLNRSRENTKPMSINIDILSQWEKEFQSSAISDRMSIFSDHLRHINLPNSPYLMLEGTIRLVRMCAVYANMDCLDEQFADFLAMQTYDPSKSIRAKYVYTFDLCGESFARLLVGSDRGIPDLADLYNNPWDDYNVVGYSHLWISRPDWGSLTTKEKDELYEIITYDLRFDYTEEELDIGYDDSLEDALCFILQDVYDEENES